MRALLLLLVLVAAGLHPSAANGETSQTTQVIGCDDLIAISVYGAPEFTRTVRVGMDGFIRLPISHIGSLDAAKSKRRFHSVQKYRYYYATLFCIGCFFFDPLGGDRMMRPGDNHAFGFA